MKQTLRVLVGILTIYCVTAVNAWNYVGHVVIAQIAYDNLTPEKKIKADQLANIIFNQLSITDQEKLNVHYSNASTFAKVALLPDVWRKWKVATLFRKFHATIPLNLLLSLEQPTANWHFIDTPYPDNLHCSINDSSNVVWALQKLENDLPKANDQNTKALLMVLTEHYMGDINQPLHTMTNVSHSCVGDRGGNDFCLKYSKNGQCSKNLHSLWDSGIGYLKNRKSIQQMAYELEQAFPKKEFTQQLNISLNELSAENYKMASNIYNLAENDKPSPDYYHQSQLVAKSQVALAGYKLSQALEKYLI